MNKLFTAVLLVLMASSCTEQPTSVTKPSEHVISLDQFGGTKLNVIEVEGCEYFVGNYDRSGLLTHKGNCKNPIHPENKGGDK